MSLELTNPEPPAPKSPRARRDPRESPRPLRTDALYWLRRLAKPKQKRVERAVSTRVFGHANGALMDAIGGDYNHPALVEEMRAWWLSADGPDALERFNSSVPLRESAWLACLLCCDAFSLPPLSSEERELHAKLHEFVRGETHSLKELGRMALRLPSPSRLKTFPRHLIHATTLVAGDVAETWGQALGAFTDAQTRYLLGLVYLIFGAGVVAMWPEQHFSPSAGLAHWDGAVARMRAMIPSQRDLDARLIAADYAEIIELRSPEIAAELYQRRKEQDGWVGEALVDVLALLQYAARLAEGLDDEGRAAYSAFIANEMRANGVTTAMLIEWEERVVAKYEKKGSAW